MNHSAASAALGAVIARSFGVLLCAWLGWFSWTVAVLVLLTIWEVAYIAHRTGQKYGAHEPYAPTEAFVIGWPASKVSIAVMLAFTGVVLLTGRLP